jgi:hypothetical protein
VPQPGSERQALVLARAERARRLEVAEEQPVSVPVVLARQLEAAPEEPWDRR